MQAFLTALLLLAPAGRSLTGFVVGPDGTGIVGAVVTAHSATGVVETTTGAGGRFSIENAGSNAVLEVRARNFLPLRTTVADEGRELRLELTPALSKVHDSVVIVASAREPRIERRDDTVYRETLFGRDDQLFHTLDAGISAGQHEGGGKSVEVRRFGFNLDHGGVAGGLKVLVDNVDQNQPTQGHGQGYLGSLKSLTPELVQDVEILNGPFSAEYGDFSGLGVVHIRLKESLPHLVTARIQGGSFGSLRSFLGWSPEPDRVTAFLAYEGSRTDGPFIHPLGYRRDNVTGSLTRELDGGRTLGFKLNLGSNRFFSSGQIPLDEVAAGRLDRFGAVDPS